MRFASESDQASLCSSMRLSWSIISSQQPKFLWVAGFASAGVQGHGWAKHRDGIQLNLSLGLAQVFYRHGRLRMYRQCQAVRVAGQDGLTIVVNGLVRISYRDPFGTHQQFFLGTGACYASAPLSYDKKIVKNTALIYKH